MVVLIRLFVNILSITALVFIYRAHHFNFIWWIILALIIFDWLTAESVRNAVQMRTSEFVVKFWVLANMVMTPVCIIVSIVGLIFYTKVNTTNVYEPNSVSSSALKDDIARHSVEAFFRGYEHFSRTNKLMHEMQTSTDPVKVYADAVSALTESKREIGQCKTELLNGVYNGWGDAVSNKLIPLIDIYLALTEPDADKSTVQKGDTLLIEFDEWLASNWSAILLQLNKEFGFEVK